MIKLLEQAIAQNLLRPLDLRFAQMLVADENPILLFIFAYLSAQTGAGHVCLPLNIIQQDKLFDGRHTELSQAIWQEMAQPSAKEILAELNQSECVNQGHSDLPSPIILDNGLLYLQRMWRYEEQIAQFFRQEQRVVDIDENQLTNVLNQLFPSVKTDAETNWQKVAAAVAITSPISIISGGPGTGKTTTVAKILAAFVMLTANEKPIIQLAAPTGKAAARLTESLGKALAQLALSEEELKWMPDQAQTIHRLLGAQPESQQVRYHRDNPLQLDILVIDEASMVDLPMMARLIEALPEHCHVIFLGDKDQLASVEAGAVLGDICRFADQGFSQRRFEQIDRLTQGALQKDPASMTTSTTPVSVVSDSLCLLRKSYRFGSHSGIGQLAFAVNQGQVKSAMTLLKKATVTQESTEREKHTDPQDIEFISLDTDESYMKMLQDVAKAYHHYLSLVAQKAAPETILHSFNQYRLLCALREGPFGVTGLNERIEMLLHRQHLIRRPINSYQREYIGRPIMIQRNDSTLGLFNGDIGIMLNNDEGEMKAFFQLPDGTLKAIQPSRLPQHETAYVMTVHKSQGSEFTHTALVLPTQFSPIVSRELLYTAITRAKQKLSLYSSEYMVKMAIQTRIQRRSGLVEKLRY
ncbi:exodeoxyribonuclease V subunit alpha [Proteus mirabilis]|uniref:exodeoxyribonuclease V subunit alpha n=1 Tax=Proteus TaxID=583 RepID=UPI000536D60D|nr:MULTISPECIES: exodeoxyribonuclease V subunit alpha [Proteus]AUU36418.1 exodeoxyribonuclease V subunit alpha [Proteus mirabilis]EKW2644777.1 exodeoxyribonuclease V subunit alpha [Proteus mirabilis]EKX5060208.1 exodeoxyribonuclease V subunit alpha [Proteus mirabilis]MBQ0521566.1 exodeoxyribonuclease V subunit alpha [Proteus mirabilis]MCI9727954.1 exodeoxyribonuclease V subunit alpha [Proteus mirabilis]